MMLALAFVYMTKLLNVAYWAQSSHLATVRDRQIVSENCDSGVWHARVDCGYYG